MSNPHPRMHTFDLLDELRELRKEIRRLKRSSSIPIYTRHATFSQSIANAANSSVGALATVSEFPGAGVDVYGTTPWGTGQFTAAADGVYSAALFSPGAVGAARTSGLILINGTIQAGADTATGGASGRVTPVLDHYFLNKNDVLAWNMFQNTGGALVMAGWVSLTHHF